MAAGQLLLTWGFAWSFVAIGVIIPHFNPAHAYQYWTDGGVLAPGGHPSVFGLVRQLGHAWPGKLQTVVMLALPTAFIALRSPLDPYRHPQPDAALHRHRQQLLGHVLALQRHLDAGHLRRRHRCDGPDRRRHGRRRRGRAGLASGRRGLWPAAQAGARRFGAAMMVAVAVALAFQFPLSQLWNASTYRISPHVAAAGGGHGARA